MLTRSLLGDDDVESERQVILEELAMDDDAPDDVALRTLTRQLFGDHGLGRDTAGDGRRSGDPGRRCAGLLRAALPGRRRRRSPSQATSITTRSWSPVEQAFAELPVGDGRVARGRPGRGEPELAIDDDSEQVHLAIGGRSVARDDPDREALDVVNHVFGGGLSSRLFDEIRERRGLAYSVYSATSAYADAGSWSVYAGAMPEHAGDVARARSTSELAAPRRGRHHGRRAGRSPSATSPGAYEMGLEDTGARMSRLGGMLATLGHVIPVDEQVARWEKVRHDDVRRVIERVYGSADRVTVTGRPAVLSFA